MGGVGSWRGFPKSDATYLKTEGIHRQVFEGGIIVAALFGLVVTAVPAETVKLVTRDDLDRPLIRWPVSCGQAIGKEPDRIQFFQDGAVILRNGKREIWHPEPKDGSALAADAPEVGLHQKSDRV